MRVSEINAIYVILKLCLLAITVLYVKKLEKFSLQAWDGATKNADFSIEAL